MCASFAGFVRNEKAEAALLQAALRFGNLLAAMDEEGINLIDSVSFDEGVAGLTATLDPAVVDLLEDTPAHCTQPTSFEDFGSSLDGLNMHQKRYAAKSFLLAVFAFAQTNALCFLTSASFSDLAVYWLGTRYGEHEALLGKQLDGERHPAIVHLLKCCAGDIAEANMFAPQMLQQVQEQPQPTGPQPRAITQRSSERARNSLLSTIHRHASSTSAQPPGPRFRSPSRVALGAGVCPL